MSRLEDGLNIEAARYLWSRIQKKLGSRPMPLEVFLGTKKAVEALTERGYNVYVQDFRGFVIVRAIKSEEGGKVAKITTIRVEKDRLEGTMNLVVEND